MSGAGAHILVGGIIRSGTTWVGKVLGECEDTIYIHEPFNPDSPWSSAFPLPIAHYHLNTEIGGVYQYLFQRLLALEPRIKGRWQEAVREEREALIAQAKANSSGQTLHCIVKDPTALYSIEWLAENFAVIPVIVLRHPIAIARSLHQLGWSDNFTPGFLRKQPALMHHFYGDLSDADRALFESPWAGRDSVERSLLQVRLFYLVLAFYHRRYPNWHYVCYETLTAQPEPAFTSLFNLLGLQLSDIKRETLFHGGDGLRDEQLNHQTELRAIVPEDVFADESGIDWREGYTRHFSDLAQQFDVLCHWQTPRES